MTWTPDDVGDLRGRRAFVTGATGGIGAWVATLLVRHGAEVVVGARSSERYRALERRLRAESPDARVGYVPLDVGSLASVREAAEWARSQWDGFDLLVANAGVMGAPDRPSPEGFEQHLATNHLGHFCLAARLWPLLTARDGRVVSVSSLLAQRAGGIDLDGLTVRGSSRRHRRGRAYAESKLATLCFALELDRRLRATGSGSSSMVAHPGWADTPLFGSGPVRWVSRVAAQPAEAGAWPLLMAATTPRLAGGSYVGPSGIGGLRGLPQLVLPPPVATPALGEALWSASEAAVGERFVPV